MKSDERIAVVGLGYVGLPLAVALARKHKGVVGFDINQKRVHSLAAGEDWTGEVEGEELHLRDMTGDRTLVVFDKGDEVVVQAGEKGIRFLLISGKPIQEPVAWHGPIVMNTRQELQQAFDELRGGTFIKESARI